MSLYLEYAKRCSSNRVYPLSIVEGLQDGDIIPDDENDIKSVLFWHYSGFAYLSGDGYRDLQLCFKQLHKERIRGYTCYEQACCISDKRQSPCPA